MKKIYFAPIAEAQIVTTGSLLMASGSKTYKTTGGTNNPLTGGNTGSSINGAF